MLTPKKHFSIIYAILVVSFFTTGAFGQEPEQTYAATTISDPQIPVGDLELLLKPLTKSELIVEAEAWLQLLKSKVKEISAAEIQMRQKSREIDRKEEEIEEKIEQIEETEKQVKEREEIAAETEKEIEEKIEAIDQTESEVEEITAKTQAELETKQEEELSGLEEDLQEKTEEVIEAQEKIKDMVEEITQADMELTEKVKKIGEAEVELQAKVKEHLLVNINKLREEQAALIDRFNVVLSALKDKGGDVEEYEKYVAAVSGLSVDIQTIKDVGAFRIMI